MERLPKTCSSYDLLSQALNWDESSEDETERPTLKLIRLGGVLPKKQSNWKKFYVIGLCNYWIENKNEFNNY